MKYEKLIHIRKTIKPYPMKFIKHTLLANSHSMREFHQKLKTLGLEVYHKKGIPSGIQDMDGKRFSWQKLDIQPKDFELLSQREQMKGIHQRISKLEELQRIREQKSKEKSKNLER